MTNPNHINKTLAEGVMKWKSVRLEVCFGGTSIYHEDPDQAHEIAVRIMTEIMNELKGDLEVAE